jgi:hypothetical protein
MERRMSDEKEIARIEEMAEDFDTDDLRDWQKDERGRAFWAKLRVLFSVGISEQRSAARVGNPVESAYRAGKTDVIEETLQLIDLMIQEKKEAEKK